MKDYSVSSDPSTPTVPVDLMAYPQWVCWRCFYNRKGKKWEKVPIDPRSGRKARANNPGTWGTLSEATALLEESGYDGIGYVFAPDDPYCGIDLDDCPDPVTGEVRPAAWEVVVALDSYTEVSPSGTPGIRSLAPVSGKGVVLVEA